VKYSAVGASDIQKKHGKMRAVGRLKIQRRCALESAIISFAIRITGVLATLKRRRRKDAGGAFAIQKKHGQTRRQGDVVTVFGTPIE